MTTHRFRKLIGTRLRASVAVLAACIAALGAHAAPYKPASSDTVLLELNDTQRSASAALRSARNASDPQSAVAMAQRFIALGRANHDERFFGYASAALQTWRDDSLAPHNIALLRADIAQHQHRFTEAIEILDRLIGRDGESADARLMRATLLMTQGRPHDARRDCQRLFALRESFAGTVCIAQTASLTGQLAGSYRLVSDLLSQLSFQSRDAQYAWALGVVAEMAERNGDLAGAERWFQKALQHAPDDLVSRLQLSDVLLQTDRAREVIDLLAAQSASEPVLLRRALAAKQLGDRTRTERALNDWQAAVRRSEQLGVTLHLRELARGQLDLLNAPAQALATALRNWDVQREPIDARLLADAARAAGDANAMQKVRKWQQEQRVEDAGLRL